jgi:hypothetical protein
VCVCVSVSVYLCVFVCACVYVCMRMYVHVRVHSCTCVLSYLGEIAMSTMGWVEINGHQCWRQDVIQRLPRNPVTASTQGIVTALLSSAEDNKQVDIQTTGDTRKLGRIAGSIGLVALARSRNEGEQGGFTNMC